MMVVFSVIYDWFRDYEIVICQLEDGKMTRFAFEKNLTAISSIKYVVLSFREDDYKYNDYFNKCITEFIEEEYSDVIIFNNHLFIDVYISKYKKKQGSKIHLGPDGLKPFNSIRKITPRWSLQRAYGFFRFILANRLRYFFYVPSIAYASLPWIDIVWVQRIDSFVNHFRKEVRLVDVLGSTMAKKTTNLFFNFDVNIYLPRLDKVLFFANQPLPSQDAYNREIEVLTELKRKFAEYIFVVKFHPLTSMRHKADIRKLSDVSIETSVMAELLIASLNNSIVLSFWSAALLLDNQQCRFYWMHPILKRDGLIPNFIQIQNPTNHIIEVDSIDYIK
ncbi:MAG: hypothetical protein ACK5RG_00570 [Cyclobacteriaceae bacterium]|jgi:hypothetical protein